MPELPEVETVRASLDHTVRGKRIQAVKRSSKRLRFPLPPRFAETLQERRILQVRRRAKYLLIDLSGGLTLLAHLGMSGKFLFHSKPPAKPALHDHVTLLFDDGTSLAFNDARRFGMMDLVPTLDIPQHKLLVQLGPEPFSPGFNARYLSAALSARKTALKLALMDQTLVAGVGNIYACEALFHTRLNPFLPSVQAAPHAAELVASIRQVLQQAIDSGGSSLRDFFHIGGETGYFQHAFAVYDRARMPCHACASPIERATQGGRSTFYCQHCQKPSEKVGDNPLQARKSKAHSASKKIKKGA